MLALAADGARRRRGRQHGDHQGLQHHQPDEHATAEDYSRRRAAFAEAGLTLYGLGNGAVHNQDDIVLNLPERDAKIEVYKRHLRHLGAAGIPYATYAHMANGIWSTARETSRGASARAFDERLAAPRWPPAPRAAGHITRR